MMMHTPGPWSAYNASNGRHFKTWRIQSPSTPIATLADVPGDRNVGNAHLIAAAPDLYEALTEVLRHCVTVAGFPEKNKGRTAQQQAAFDAAHAALTKAGGT